VNTQADECAFGRLVDTVKREPKATHESNSWALTALTEPTYLWMLGERKQVAHFLDRAQPSLPARLMI
jgi:hypothetical protein